MIKSRMLNRAITQGVFFAVLTALVTLSSLSAQVDYVRDLTFPSGAPAYPVLLQTKAPIDKSDPLYNPSLPDTQYIATTHGRYTFNPGTGMVSLLIDFPPDIIIDRQSFTMLTGDGTSEPVISFFYGTRRRLYIYDVATRLPVPPASGVIVPISSVSSMAAPDRTNLTAVAGNLADNGLYSINSNTGEAIQLVAFGGEDPDDFSLDTYFHAYSPNGLVYLLDYGNDRMQMLNPANDFSFAGEFALNPLVTTANMQFAIGVNGNVYLGDGLGGGSYYSANGSFIGEFSLDAPVVPSLDIGANYLSTDANGGVYVFDNTGFHQYLDASVVPEPSTWAFILFFAALVSARYWSRSNRARRQGN